MCNSNDTTGIGCYKELAEGAYFDECGVCRGLGLTCFNSKTAGIGAGALAAIIIGVAAGLGAMFGGSVKGVRYYQKMRVKMGNDLHENPMFQEQRTQGENPFYTEMQATKE